MVNIGIIHAKNLGLKLATSSWCGGHFQNVPLVKNWWDVKILKFQAAAIIYKKISWQILSPHAFGRRFLWGVMWRNRHSSLEWLLKIISVEPGCFQKQSRWRLWRPLFEPRGRHTNYSNKMFRLVNSPVSVFFEGIRCMNLVCQYWAVFFFILLKSNDKMILL